MVQVSLAFYGNILINQICLYKVFTDFIFIFLMRVVLNHLSIPLPHKDSFSKVKKHIDEKLATTLLIVETGIIAYLFW